VGRGNPLKKRPLSSAVLLLFVGLLVWYAFFALPRDLFPDATATVVYSAEGELLGARIAADEQWRFPQGDSLPHHFEESIISFEDAWFYYHPGINPVSTVRALYQNVKSGKVISGGSTLSMQVIRLSRENPPRTYWEKLYEMLLATRLEWRYSKSEILALYAAHAPFGGNVVGLEAAAWRYFGRASHSLSWAEAASLAVLPNAPGLIRPGKSEEHYKIKRNRLLKKLWHAGKLNERAYALALLEPLPGEPYAIPTKAQHLTDLAEREQQGKVVHSTLSVYWQHSVEQVLEHYRAAYSGNGVHNAAALLVELKTGAVKAYVGNYKQVRDGHGQFNDMLQTPRSSGSILKPFLYAAMLEEGALLPKQLVPDLPITFGGFKPENYIEQYDGAVAADEALYRSLNIPAVIMLKEYGLSRFKERLGEFGFSTLTREASHYGLSMILGGAEVTAFELADAYRLMGARLQAYQTSGKEINNSFESIYWHREARRVKQSSPYRGGSLWHTVEALKQVNRPDSEMGWQFFNAPNVAWKTGTSFGFRDAWAVGITNTHVAVVWVGNADGEGRPGLVGAEAAGPILFDILRLTRSEANFPVPYNEMEEKRICRASGMLASSNCPKVDSVFVPRSQRSAGFCHVHQLVQVEVESGERVKRSCTNKAWRTDTFFVLPPAQAWHFAKQYSNYRFLPPWSASCKEAGSRELAIIYPEQGSTYYLPLELDGARHKLIAEVAVLRQHNELFWHLDGEYLGNTQEFHQIPLHLKAGKHTLSVTDKSGNEVRSTFTVLLKED
jgi:penicillin-binding protein 1C